MIVKSFWRTRHLAVASAVAAIAIAGIWVGGCGDKTSKDKVSLRLLCGNSFIPPMEQLCKEFSADQSGGVSIAMDVGGSEDLLPQIKTAGRGDLFITHDPFLDYVREAGLLADHVEVGFVAPVLAVQPGNPKGLASIDDLVRPGLTIALSNPEYSTCGEMVFALLDKKGIKDAVLKSVGNRLTKGHSNLGTLVQTKAVDAVVMWNGVANTFKDSLEVVKTPYEYDSEIQVHVMGLSHSKHPEQTQKFIDFVRTRGPAVFAEHGYVK